MVMPRSRSRSMASSTCASISRACSAPVISRKRSASVDLPWSMCAMTEKLRMKRGFIYAGAKVPRCRGARVPARIPLALINGHVPLRVLRADVFRARANQAVVRVLLEHVRGPARDAADRENRREQIDRDAERVVRRRGIEVHVRIQLL